MIQVLLSGDGMKMDPLVGLYYFAPVCAVMNFLVAMPSELPTFTWAAVSKVGVGMLFLNASIAFLLNVTSVFLVCCPHIPFYMAEVISQKLTASDWTYIGFSHDPHRHLQKHPPHPRVHCHLEHQDQLHADRWLRHCPRRPNVLLPRIRTAVKTVPILCSMGVRCVGGNVCGVPKLGFFRLEEVCPHLLLHLWRLVCFCCCAATLRPFDQVAEIAGLVWHGIKRRICNKEPII